MWAGLWGLHQGRTSASVGVVGIWGQAVPQAGDEAGGGPWRAMGTVLHTPTPYPAKNLVRELLGCTLQLPSAVLEVLCQLCEPTITFLGNPARRLLNSAIVKN